MDAILNRITIEAGKCGGRPCVRGMRIRVVDVLDLLIEGLSFEAVTQELPDLEVDDVKACLLYARLDQKFAPLDWHGEVLKERLAQYEAGEISASDWTEAQARIRKSVGDSQ